MVGALTAQFACLHHNFKQGKKMKQVSDLLKCSTGVALPAAFLRWSIPPDEPAVATQLLAIFVGIAALIDRNLRDAGQVQHFEVSAPLGLLFQSSASA